jgi:hypothetical protein
MAEENDTEGSLLRQIESVKKEIENDDFYDATDGFRWGHSSDKIKPILENLELRLDNLRLRERAKNKMIKTDTDAAAWIDLQIIKCQEVLAGDPNVRLKIVISDLTELKEYILQKTKNTKKKID